MKKTRKLMNAKEKSLHVESVCIALKKSIRLHGKKTLTLREEVKQLTENLRLIDESFTCEKEAYCEEEGISYKFVTAVLTGRREKKVAPIVSLETNGE